MSNFNEVNSQAADPKPHTVRRHDFEIDGMVVRAMEAGSGETVVWLSDSLEFSPLADRLADDHHIIVIHALGASARVLAVALQRLDVARFSLIGLSGRAAAALDLAGATGTACETLILMAPLFDVRFPEHTPPDVPILLLLGTDDSRVPPSAVADLAARLPRAHPVLVYAAGHALDCERVEAVAAVTRDFLARRDKFIVRDASDRLFP